MAIDIGLRIIQILDSIGIKPGTFLGKASNVKKAFTGGKPTFFKPDVLETLRATDGTFTDALNLIEEEAMYIANATDVEKMAFLNNLMEYKSLGGPQKTKSGITALDQAKNLTDEAKNLQTSTEDLMGLAKTMKEDAEKSLAKSKQDLDDWITTGGQPFKAKDNKFLGGSMHEEGQLRTGIREFLQTEYKNGRLKLDELDVERIMKHSPMLEHDPIKVFKKIYGDEAYTKAGSFPGAFEKGENYKHYEQIFRENMGDEVLQIKNNEYKGDGKLVLTEREEVFTPTPDDDVPFAKGGLAGIRQGYAGGLKVSKKILSALNPKNIKKAVDNIFKTGDYKYDASMAAESFVELNPQLFGGKLYDDLDQATQMEIYGAVLGPIQQDVAMALKMKKASKPTKTLEGIEKTGTINISDPKVAEEFARFMKETSPGDAKKVEQTVELSNFDTKGRKKNAGGGLAALLGEPQGYYTGGMVDVEPNLSDIGHGSDSLMARTRLISPNNQATTSTGLNYLLAEDNDNIRVPFNEGKTYKQKLEEEIKKRLKYKRQGMEFDNPLGPEGTFNTGNPPKVYELAEGGRIGFSKGKGVDLARRGFLKVVGGTVGAIAALKSGALKLLGKSSPKAIPKIVEIGKGSGVPDWFEPMVNKVLADGLDVTKGNAIVDGQVVKRLDTPNGQVDVYHNERSGEIDVEYASESHAALGDSVHLNYKPGWSMADEGNPSPADEFLASENIPEGKAYGPDDYEIEMGENTVDEVGGLFSDTSELEKLGGGNINMREILKNIEKKKKLKKMNDNPTEFVTDNQGDFIQFDDINPDPT
jgi:hypothetical protein